jgi:NTE family protein
LTRALVLGGGGITGIAWELGLLAGLRRHDADLTDADLVIGTSAGAFVGALVACGADPDESAARAEVEELADLSPRVDMLLLAQAFAVLAQPGPDPVAARIRLGALARSAPVGDPQEQVVRFAGHLPAPQWPRTPRLVITAVDTASGELVAWDA